MVVGILISDQQGIVIEVGDGKGFDASNPDCLQLQVNRCSRTVVNQHLIRNNRQLFVIEIQPMGSTDFLMLSILIFRRFRIGWLSPQIKLED